MSIETLDERRARGMAERLTDWAREAADQATTDVRRHQLKDWAVGVSIAMLAFGYDDLAEIADEIWNPRRANNGHDRNHVLDGRRSNSVGRHGIDSRSADRSTEEEEK